MPGYHLPLFAAAATGIWDRHGLEVELVDPEPGPANARAAAEGRYDACLTSVAHFVRAKAEDAELAARFVFMIARRTHMAALFVDGRPAAHGRPIETFEDLEGASSLGSPDKPFGLEYAALLDGLRLRAGAVVDSACVSVSATRAGRRSSSNISRETSRRSRTRGTSGGGWT